jgi:hypothetical protein
MYYIVTFFVFYFFTSFRNTAKCRMILFIALGCFCFVEKLILEYFESSIVETISWIFRKIFYLTGIAYLVVSYFQFTDIGELSLQMIQELRNSIRGNPRQRPRPSISRYLRENLGVTRYNY